MGEKYTVLDPENQQNLGVKLKLQWKWIVIILLMIIFSAFAGLNLIRYVHGHWRHRSESGLPPVPNIGYLGSGYNIMKGNPHATNPGQGVDPGFGAYVFDLSVYNHSTTPDRKYSIPDGIDVLNCDFCTTSTQSATMSGAQSYQNFIHREIGGNIGAWAFAFGASADFKEVTQKSSAYQNVFIEIKAECCVYRAQISEYTPPALSKEFIAAVQSLPASYQESSYMKLLEYFGTHVVNSMTMGGRYGMRSTFSQQSWSQISSTTLNLQIMASLSLLHFTPAAKTMSESDRNIAISYLKFVTETDLFIVGGQLTTNGSVAEWAQSAEKNPMPLSTQLVPLFELLTPTYFPKEDRQILAEKCLYLLRATGDYCAWLARSGKVAQCTAPGNDPPMPQGSIFGGFYQTDDCNKNNVANVFTNGLSCPPGFTQSRVGRVLTPESKCGADQFICLMNKVTSDPLQNFGGMYQVGDSNSANNYVNPLTGSMSCPNGYVSVTIGRVFGPEAKGPAYQYACLNTSHVPSYESTAGFYQVTDTNAKDRIVNWFTSAPSCPPQYCAVQRGRVVAPGGNAGADQNSCVACNLVNSLHFDVKKRTFEDELGEENDIEDDKDIIKNLNFGDGDDVYEDDNDDDDEIGEEEDGDDKDDEEVLKGLDFGDGDEVFEDEQ